MKSYLPILLILLFVCLSRQQVSFTSVYNEFDRVRARFCLSPIVRNATLESQARTSANNFCSGTLPTSKYAALTVTSSGNLTEVTLLSFSNTSFYNSFNAWNCATDLPAAGQTNTSFARHVLLAAQSVGCSYNFPLPCGGVLTTTNYFRMVCLFDQPAYTNVRVFPSSNCACTTATPTTAAPTTAAPTTTASTTAPTTAAPTTRAPTTAAPTTVAPTTAAPTTTAPTTRSPTTTAPTTSAPTTVAPTTTAPTTRSPTTTSPTTAAPTTAAPTSTPVPTQSPGVPLYQAVNPTPTATVNEWLKIHHTARDCVGLPRLTWDESLAQDALNWARQGMANSNNINGACKMFHSNSTSFPARVGQGENINYVWWGNNTSFTFNEVTFITNAVESWYTEYLNYTCSSNTCSLSSTNTFTTTLSTGMILTLNACGHYTQLIWRNTTRVGCAYAKCDNDPAGEYKYYGACRYSPQGNYVGVNPLEPTVNCGPFCTRAGGRSLSTQTTVNNPTPVAKTNTSSFFKSESEIYVLALSVFILVVVVSIFVIVLINFVKNRNSNDDYQLLETK